jgi:hypothetical protein
VNVSDLNTVDFAGSSVSTDRAQITSIRPLYKPEGRSYQVSALSYSPSFVTGTEIIISGTRTSINLHNDYAEGVPTAVNLTFIFDATIVGSSSNAIPAIRAGDFASGSVITLILINGADLQAAGGKAGNGETLERDFETSSWFRFGISDGEDGGTVYNAEGVTTHIYFSGATGNVNYPTADGYIRAPQGGAGGFQGAAISDTLATAGNGGKGGAGRNGGGGGLGGYVRTSEIIDNGQGGPTGTPNEGLWGLDGANNNAVGGAKGKGVVDSGGSVTFHGEDSTRYVNGGGDH